MLPAHGHSVPSDKEIAKHYHGTLKDTIKSIVPGASNQEVTTILREFLEIDNVYIKHPNEHIFDDAAGLVKRAHDAGVQQILVTNRYHGVDRFNASPRTFVENSVLKGAIDTIICGDDTEHRKPKPEVLSALLHGIVPASTVVIGDQFVDAVFARNIGAKAILIQRGAEPIAHFEHLDSDVRRDIRVVKSLKEVQV